MDNIQYDWLSYRLAKVMTDIHKVDERVLQLFFNNDIQLLSPVAFEEHTKCDLSCGAGGAYHFAEDVVTVVAVFDTRCGDITFTALHELAHASGNAKRLGRAIMKNSGLCDEVERHTEEMVAQIGAGIMAEALGTHTKKQITDFIQYYALSYTKANMFKARSEAEEAAAWALRGSLLAAQKAA